MARAAITILGTMLAASAAADAPAPAPAGPQLDPRALVLVVRLESPLQGLSAADARRLFMGETIHDAAGARIVPLNHLPGSPERTGFDRAVLGMSAEEVGRFWIDRKIRGQPPAPRAIASCALMQKLVARVPGAVGYVRASRLEPGVRVLPIDGRRPGDPGYPLMLPAGAGS